MYVLKNRLNKLNRIINLNNSIYNQKQKNQNNNLKLSIIERNMNCI